MPPASLRNRLIRLAHRDPTLREYVLPLLRRRAAAEPTLAALQNSARGLLAAYGVAFGDAAREAALVQAPDDARARSWLRPMGLLQGTRGMGARQLFAACSLLDAVAADHPEAKWLVGANDDGVDVLFELAERVEETPLPAVNAPLQGGAFLVTRMEAVVQVLAKARPLAAEAILAAWVNR